MSAIRATFADWRTVKTRKALQLIFEIPLEQQAKVLTVLGAPMPDTEIWCGIARLAAIDEDEQPRETPQEEMPTMPAITPAERGKLAYATGTEGEQARTRAAMLPKDVRFRMWALGSTRDGTTRPEAVEEAASFIRLRCCDGESRSLIASNPEYLRRFLAMETQYLLDNNLMAEPR